MHLVLSKLVHIVYFLFFEFSGQVSIFDHVFILLDFKVAMLLSQEIQEGEAEYRQQMEELDQLESPTANTPAP